MVNFHFLSLSGGTLSWSSCSDRCATVPEQDMGGGPKSCSSLPGLKYPRSRDLPLKAAELWLEDKRRDDGAEGLWRVHDHLYDLSTWIDRHPGGSIWITLTKGTDITEAFETYHVNKKPEQLLKQFLVRSARTPRNSPYTFKDDGFYRTLKRKVQQTLENGSWASTTWHSKAISDILLLATMAIAVLSATTMSFVLGTLSGLLLALTVISAHNFFHQRDNFRMYYFDLSFMSSRNWRVSHAMSHHLFTNSVLDLEISMLEPFLQMLPSHNKPWWARYGAWLSSPFVYSFIYHSHVITRLALFVAGHPEALQWDNLIPLTLPAIMYMFAQRELYLVLMMWMWIVLASSFWFGLIGLNAGHHHPELFHDGDAPRKDLDWGLAQLDAVRNRPAISTSLLFVLVTFGDHALHHLFPTLDHSVLPYLQPALQETCKEFGFQLKEASIFEMVKGQFLQLLRTIPNAPPAECVKS